MGQWRNPGENQEIPQKKWKWKHNEEKSEWSKNSSTKEVYNDRGLLQEKSQTMEKKNSQQRKGNNKDQRKNK